MKDPANSLLGELADVFPGQKLGADRPADGVDGQPVLLLGPRSFSQSALPSWHPSQAGSESKELWMADKETSKKVGKNLVSVLALPGDLFFQFRSKVGLRADIQSGILTSRPRPFWAGIYDQANGPDPEASERPAVAGPLLIHIRIKKKPSQPISADYLHWFLNHTAQQSWFLRHSKGQTMKVLGAATLRRLPVVVPYDLTQQKIAKIGKDLLDERENFLKLLAERMEFFEHWSYWNAAGRRGEDSNA